MARRASMPCYALPAGMLADIVSRASCSLPACADWPRSRAGCARPTAVTTIRSHQQATENFAATASNQVWLADLTYIRTGEGWLFLAALTDMHTRKVVGWSMREALHALITLEALDMAIRRQRSAPGLIQHSDRGIQYAADEYRQALATAKITPSMSRKGNCLDNAPMESFFHTIKVERVHHRVYATRAEARRDLFTYIEGFYNSRRLHSALGYRSPADMEQMAA